MRSPIVVVTAAAVLFSPVAQAGQSRSGMILGTAVYPGPGVGVDAGCSQTAECASWLASGCRSDVAGHEVAVHSAIVDVRTLAGSRRLFWISQGWLAYVARTVVEFWSTGCARVAAPAVIPAPVWGDAAMHVGVPANARWMTVSAPSASRMSWGLF